MIILVMYGTNHLLNKIHFTYFNQNCDFMYVKLQLTYSPSGSTFLDIKQLIITPHLLLHSVATGPILSHMNSIYVFKFKTHVQITIPSTYWSPNWHLPFRLSTKFHTHF
jgi:hypothetical protein